MAVLTPLATADEATLAALYEAGEYLQALRLIDSGLLAQLRDRPDDPELAGDGAVPTRGRSVPLCRPAVRSWSWSASSHAISPSCAPAARAYCRPAPCMAFVVKLGEESLAMIDAGSADVLEGRDGSKALGTALAAHLEGCTFLVVGSGGRLKRAALKKLLPGVRAWVVRSGREIMCAPAPAQSGSWLQLLSRWLGG